MLPKLLQVTEQAYLFACTREQGSWTAKPGEKVSLNKD